MVVRLGGVAVIEIVRPLVGRLAGEFAGVLGDVDARAAQVVLGRLDLPGDVLLDLDLDLVLGLGRDQLTRGGLDVWIECRHVVLLHLSSGGADHVRSRRTVAGCLPPWPRGPRSGRVRGGHSVAALSGRPATTSRALSKRAATTLTSKSNDRGADGRAMTAISAPSGSAGREPDEPRDAVLEEIQRRRLARDPDGQRPRAPERQRQRRPPERHGVDVCAVQHRPALHEHGDVVGIVRRLGDRVGVALHLVCAVPNRPSLKRAPRRAGSSAGRLTAKRPGACRVQRTVTATAGGAGADGSPKTALTAAPATVPQVPASKTPISAQGPPLKASRSKRAWSKRVPRHSR